MSEKQFNPVFKEDQGDFKNPRQKLWIVMRCEPDSSGFRWVKHLLTGDYQAALDKTKDLIMHPVVYSGSITSAEDVIMAEVVPTDIAMTPTY